MGEGEKKEEEKPDEKMEEEKKEAAEKEKRKKEDEEEKRLDAEMGDAPPAAELTEEEKRVFFPKRDHADLTAGALASGLSHFSPPVAEEGFDKIEYVWDKEKEVKEYLTSWVREEDHDKNRGPPALRLVQREVCGL